MHAGIFGKTKIPCVFKNRIPMEVFVSHATKSLGADRNVAYNPHFLGNTFRLWKLTKITLIVWNQYFPDACFSIIGNHRSAIAHAMKWRSIALLSISICIRYEGQTRPIPYKIWNSCFFSIYTNTSYSLDAQLKGWNYICRGSEESNVIINAVKLWFTKAMSLYIWTE